MGQAGVGRVNISWLFSVDVGQQVEDKHPSFLTLLGILGVKREGRDIQDRKLLLLALEGVCVCVCKHLSDVVCEGKAICSSPSYPRGYILRPPVDT